jgi:hypothetical protein
VQAWSLAVLGAAAQASKAESLVSLATVSALHAQFVAVAERERTLVSGEWVRKIITDHDGAVVQLVKAMPKQLAGRISPHDPEHAEHELERWAQEVFLKTLYATNPFS